MIICLLEHFHHSGQHQLTADSWPAHQQLGGTVPISWPSLAFRSARRKFRMVSCSGVVQDPCGQRSYRCPTIEGTCNGNGESCVALTLWYNCMDSITLPPVSSNTWNWNSSSMYLSLSEQGVLNRLPRHRARHSTTCNLTNEDRVGSEIAVEDGDHEQQTPSTFCNSHIGPFRHSSA